MFPDVETLFDVLGCEWRLSRAKLQAYLARLGDPIQHGNALIEFAPILRLPADVGVQHEVSEHGDSTTVDWRIDTPGQPVLLLEVKNRILDLIESFELMKRQEGHAPIASPQHDHSRLFRSVEHKFMPRRPAEKIQGVWVKAGLLQEETEFRSAFEALDLGRVHVAILGDWGEDAHVVATDDTTKKSVLQILRLKQSKRLVFKR